MKICSGICSVRREGFDDAKCQPQHFTADVVVEALSVAEKEWVETRIALVLL